MEFLKNLFRFFYYSSFWYPYFLAFMICSKIAYLITNSIFFGVVFSFAGCFYLGNFFCLILEKIANFLYDKKIFYGALFEAVYIVSVPYLYIFMDFYRFFSKEYFVFLFIRIPNFVNYGNFINIVIYFALYFFLIRKYTLQFMKEKQDYLEKLQEF